MDDRIMVPLLILLSAQAGLDIVFILYMIVHFGGK